MECLEKPVWNNYTEEELWQIQIPELDKAAEKKVKKNWDSIAKPLDGMGRFETLTARIGAITGTDELDIRKKAVLILCADNGIVEEGISQSGKEVTLAVAKSMAQKQSSVCKMAQALGAVTIPVDIGIDSREVTDGVRNKKIRCGTRNFRKEPAMTQEEVPIALTSVHRAFMLPQSTLTVIPSIAIRRIYSPRLETPASFMRSDMSASSSSVT